MNSIAVIIGHTYINKGANGLIEPEFDFNKMVSNGLFVDVFTHSAFTVGYSRRQKETANKTKDYDYTFELHYNSSSNPMANGCEALYYYRNQKGKEASLLFCAEMENLGLKNRGAKPLHNKNQRGYGFVVAQKPTAIILEPFFGSNASDVSKVDVKSYVHALNSYFEKIKRL